MTKLPFTETGHGENLLRRRAVGPPRPASCGPCQAGLGPCVLFALQAGCGHRPSHYSPQHSQGWAGKLLEACQMVKAEQAGITAQPIRGLPAGRKCPSESRGAGTTFPTV
ncbi:hypothetical protein Cadr_000018803 [Camelus dromedarius]|uniref:Uncharacterized protein n=1 Tax=Camelus dromedarius TaxID=9838 RepID=A0A5N4D5R0_CAMDR|nr:hypothetical protein Cadr_000018803 [Camelus dromedarius]